MTNEELHARLKSELQAQLQSQLTVQFAAQEKRLKKHSVELFLDLKQYVDMRFDEQELKLDQRLQEQSETFNKKLDQRLKIQTEAIEKKIEERIQWLFDQTSGMFGVITDTYDPMHERHDKRLRRVELVTGVA